MSESNRFMYRARFSKRSLKYIMRTIIALVLFALYIVVVSGSMAQGSKQRPVTKHNAYNDSVKDGYRIVEPELTERKACYYERFSLPIKENDIKNGTDREMWEAAVYLNKVGRNEEDAMGPGGFMIEYDACFVADTAASRVIQVYPPEKLFEQAEIDESVLIKDIWVNTETDYYILGCCDGIQIFHYDGRQFERLDAEFSGLDEAKYIKAYFSDGKVVIVKPDNSIYYYDVKGLKERKESPWGLSIGRNYVEDVTYYKQFRMDTLETSTFYPLGRDKQDNIYIVCNRAAKEGDAGNPQQFLIKISVQREEAEIMEIEYNPIGYNDLKLSEDGKLYQMIFEDKTFAVKELRFMDIEDSSAQIGEVVEGRVMGTPLKQELRSVSFINRKTGFLSIVLNDEMSYNSCEYRLLKTIDGGSSWNTVLSGMDLSGLKFITELKGFSYNDGRVFKTDDGGYNWEPLSVKGFENIYQIDVVNERVICCFVVRPEVDLRQRNSIIQLMGKELDSASRIKLEW